MLSIKEINLLQAQNEGLKNQNKELQEEIKKYAAINEQETKDYAELLKENAKLKTQIKDLQIRKDRYYLKGLVQERQISDYITLLQEIKETAEQSNIDCIYRISVIRKILTKAESEVE